MAADKEINTPIANDPCEAMGAQMAWTLRKMWLGEDIKIAKENIETASRLSPQELLQLYAIMKAESPGCSIASYNDRNKQSGITE
jgi:hypothetical protein